MEREPPLPTPYPLRTMALNVTPKKGFFGGTYYKVEHRSGLGCLPLLGLLGLGVVGLAVIGGSGSSDTYEATTQTVTPEMAAASFVSGGPKVCSFVNSSNPQDNVFDMGVAVTQTPGGTLFAWSDGYKDTYRVEGTQFSDQNGGVWSFVGQSTLINGEKSITCNN